jgi:hypothetical protein
MHRLHLRTTVVSGAAIGLVAGAAVFGAASSRPSAPSRAAFTATTAPAAPVAAPPVRAKRVRPEPARPARCSAGTTLRKGVCIVHRVRTVVIPAPENASSRGNSPSGSDTGTAQRSRARTYAGGDRNPARQTPEARPPAPTGEHSQETAQHEGETSEHARETAEGARGTGESAGGTAGHGPAAAGHSAKTGESDSPTGD